MSFTSWLQGLRSTLTPGRTQRRHGRRGPLRTSTNRLSIEPLEDRSLPSFSPATSFPVGTTCALSSQAVVTADFNHDGNLDLVTRNQNGTVSVLMGDGRGGFGAPNFFAVGPVDYGTSLAVADFNNDSNPDLATTGVGFNLFQASVLLGNGDGTFQLPHYNGYTSLPNGSPALVAVGDLNADGNADFVCTDPDINDADNGSLSFYSAVEVLLGDGQGGFTDAYEYRLQGPGTYGLAVADLNADGKPDVVTVDYYTGTVSVLMGLGDGLLSNESFFATGQSPTSVAVGDFTGDGIPDLVTGGLTVDVLPGLGDGTFAPPIHHATSSSSSLRTADFNGDGKLDVAWVAGTVSVLLGQGDGTLTGPIDRATGSFPRGLAIGDFNGDGRPDAATVDLAAVVFPTTTPSTVLVLLNDGNWTPPPPAPQASSFTVSGFPSPISAGQAGTFTVTALDSSGSVLTGYTGTVHFTSSDPLANLPPDHTFTAADNGTHTFSATLKTVGTQAIRVSDATTGVGGVESGITVYVGAATMSVTGFPSTTTAGIAGNFTVTLRDLYGNIAGSYRGTVHFTSSDAKASLPANYTFTAGDAGVHTFTATLKTAGTQSITAKDTVTGSLTSTDGGITVNVSRASQFFIAAPPSVIVGVAFSLTVTVEDAYGNVVIGYTGTIHFTSSDGQAKLPANYTFTASDKGVHTFTGLILQKSGKQTITIMDTLLSFSTSVDVLPKKK
jgi:hypothetical protein